MKPIKKELSDRVEYRLPKGNLHREDGPAIEWYNGDKEWRRNGQLHRKDGPAIEYNDGSKVWYKNDQIHREDGPAIEWYGGTKEWFKNGQRHREDGPAIEYSDGSKVWWRNGIKVQHIKVQHKIESKDKETNVKEFLKEIILSNDVPRELREKAINLYAEEK